MGCRFSVPLAATFTLPPVFPLTVYIAALSEPSRSSNKVPGPKYMRWEIERMELFKNRATPTPQVATSPQSSLSSLQEKFRRSKRGVP